MKENGGRRVKGRWRGVTAGAAGGGAGAAGRHGAGPARGGGRGTRGAARGGRVATAGGGARLRAPRVAQVGFWAARVAGRRALE